MRKTTTLTFENLEPRRLLAVFPAPELADIAFTPPTYTAPSGAYWVSSSSSLAALSTNSANPGQLAYTLNNAPVGSTVILKEGTYRVSHSLTRRLTILAESGKRVYFKGTDLATGWTRVGTQDLWYVPWTTKLTGTEPRTINPSYPESIDFDMVYRNGLSLTQTWDDPTTTAIEGRSNNAFGPGKFWIGSIGGQQRVYVADNPTSATMEISRRSNNFNFATGSSGSILRGITFAHAGTNGMTINTGNITLENNLFAWNAYFGLGVYSGTVNLRNNAFVSNGHNGISGNFGFASDAGLVQSNRFAHNNAEGFSLSWNAAAFKITRGKNLRLFGNTFENNYCNGFWADVHANGVQVAGNISRNNSGFGVFFESSHGAKIAFNTIHNNLWSGIAVSDASGAAIWNNTLHANGIGITVKDGSRFNKQVINDSPGSPINFDPLELVNGSWEITRENVIRNNIVSSSSQYQYDFAAEVYAYQQDPDPQVTDAVGNVKWSDTEIPEGTSKTDNGQVIFNPRPLTQLGSRSMFYSSDGTTGSWTTIADNINSTVFHANPSTSGTSKGPVAWIPTAGKGKVVYTASQMASNTNQNRRYKSLSSSTPLYENAAAGDFRLKVTSGVVAWGEALPQSIRDLAAAAGITVADPLRPNPGSRVDSPPPPAILGSISGHFFDDANFNQRFDPGEPPIVGRTILLDTNNNGRLDPGEPSTLSGTDGFYRFDELPAGLYRVRAMMPLGWTYSTTLVNIQLAEGQNVQSANMGAWRFIVGVIGYEENSRWMLLGGSPGITQDLLAEPTSMAT